MENRDSGYKVKAPMQVNFLFNEKPVEVGTFVVKIKADAPSDLDERESEVKQIRSAVRERFVMANKQPVDLPVIYAPEK